MGNPQPPGTPVNPPPSGPPPPPAAGPAGPAGPAGWPLPPPRRRVSGNRVLLIVLIVFAVLAVAGAGTAFFLYNKKTELDRSTPTVAVHQFLNAAFFDKDAGRVELFACPQWTEERTAEVQGRFHPEVKVSWEDVAEQSRQEKQAVVTARMRLVDQGFVDFQDWRFEVVEDDGWRVCDARPAAA